MTGRNGKIGPVPVTPRMPLSQPHWKTATVTPMAAANDSRLVTTAVSETTAERNRISSMMKPRMAPAQEKAIQAQVSAKNVAKSTCSVVTFTGLMT